MKQDYISLRNSYLPKKLKVIFILESPPQGHGYIYNPAGKVSEVLFRAFMKLIDFVPADKDEGLKKLANHGYLLIDPIYIPVNKLPDKEANLIIIKNYGKFREDLNTLIKGNKSLPIILIKVNILRLLEKRMLADGYNVINEGLPVPFPLHYHINSFLKRTKGLLSKLDLRTSF